MINPTGLIKTDLLILDIYANNFRGQNNIKEWTKVLKIHGVPKLFINGFGNPRAWSEIPLKVFAFFMKNQLRMDPTSRKSGSWGTPERR